MGKPEGTIETYMRKQAEQRGFLFYKFTSPANDGVPDRILIGNGYTCFVELKKSETELPRKLQRRVINRMIDHGAFVYVIGSKPGADKLLAALEQGKLPAPEKQPD